MGLVVNKNKTKCIVMSIGKVNMPNFTFDRETLEKVTCLKYLGMYMHKNGKFDSQH